MLDRERSDKVARPNCFLLDYQSVFLSDSKTLFICPNLPSRYKKKEKENLCKFRLISMWRAATTALLSLLGKCVQQEQSRSLTIEATLIYAPQVFQAGMISANGR